MDIEDGIKLGLGFGIGGQFAKIFSKALVEDEIVCFYCESEVDKNSNFCSDCGKSLLAPECSDCKCKNPLGSSFCNNCGTKL